MSVDDILNYRQGVLLACAGALLHNLGKVSSRFIEQQLGTLKGSYFYQHVPGLFLADCSGQGIKVRDFLDRYKFKGKTEDARKRLSKSLGDNNDKTTSVLQLATKDLLRSTPIFPLPPPFNDRKYRIGDLIEYLSQGEPFYSRPKGCSRYLVEELLGSSLFTHLMNRSHHGASGGEKEDIYAKQQILPLYLATPLGYERLAPDTSRYDEIKEKVEKIIQSYFDPKTLGNPFPIGQFMRELEEHFRQILGDTQRGLNDVTVWDIGHSGMAFLKAGIWSLAGRASLSHDDLADWTSPNYPRWRLWRVGLNGLDFLAGAVSVADLRVRQRKLRDYLDRVRYFAEEVFPVATEVYRDENGGIYVFPDWDRKSSELDTFERIYGFVFQDKPWSQKAGEIKKAVSDKFQGRDLISLPEIFGLRPKSEFSSRNFHHHPECYKGSSPLPSPTPAYIGDTVREWIEHPPAAEPAYEAFTDVIRDDLCPYCGTRSIGGGEQLVAKLPPNQRKLVSTQKARQRKICCVCMSEHGRVTEDWWAKENFSTIWVDEVADANGRVALMVGKFGVENMLQDLVYPPRNMLAKKPSSGTKCALDATLSASFARFRRVWETTACFWREVAPLKDQVSKQQAQDWQEALANCEAVKALGNEGRRRRLVLELKLNQMDKLSIAPYHAYELEVAGVSIGVVPTEVKGDRVMCVTIENLGYIAAQLDAPKTTCTDPCAAASWVYGQLQPRDGKKKARIKAAHGYGHGKEDYGTAEIDEVWMDATTYYPVIPVLAEPRVFAVLLPASTAVRLVMQVYRKYVQEMGKVRWRLPLILGTVFFPRHLPLRLVLDAGWRLLARRTGPVVAKVTGTRPAGTAVHDPCPHPSGKQWPSRVTVEAKLTHPVPDKHDRQVFFDWEVPTAMGDNSTFDMWYPWVKLVGNPSLRPLMLRRDTEKGTESWVHVMELERDDEIEFYPSTWDFVFLEQAGERFALAYDGEGRRLGLRRRPYYLEELDGLFQLWSDIWEKLNPTQVHSLWQTLWNYGSRLAIGACGARPAPSNDKLWQQFCRYALLNAAWKDKDRLPLPFLDHLTCLTATGVFFDLFELFLTILKEEGQA